MAKIYMVRHGEAAAKWDQAADPGLSEKGWAQSKAVSEALADLGALPLISSPLKRCRETAQPSEKRLATEATVIDAVAEIPSPDGIFEGRRPWLQKTMEGTWAEADAWLQPWRQGVVDALLALSEDTIVFSHFVAINVAVGTATGDDRVIGFRPDNCSITCLSNDGGKLALIEQGREADTEVR
jgi:broad specificity phosphatase PhoE